MTCQKTSSILVVWHIVQPSTVPPTFLTTGGSGRDFNCLRFQFISTVSDLVPLKVVEVAYYYHYYYFYQRPEASKNRRRTTTTTTTSTTTNSVSDLVPLKGWVIAATVGQCGATSSRWGGAVALGLWSFRRDAINTSNMWKRPVYEFWSPSFFRWSITMVIQEKNRDCQN